MPQLTEQHVVAMVACPQCKAQRGRACKATGTFHGDTHVHRGRWLVERDLRTGRAVWPTEAG